MYLNYVFGNLRIVSHALCYQRRCQANYELIWPAHKNYVHIFRRPRRHIKIISKHIKIICFDIIIYTFIHFVSQNVYPDMTSKNVPIQSTYLHIHFSRQPDFSLQRRLVRIYNFYTFSKCHFGQIPNIHFYIQKNISKRSAGRSASRRRSSPRGTAGSPARPRRRAIFFLVLERERERVEMLIIREGAVQARRKPPSRNHSDAAPPNSAGLARTSSRPVIFS